MVEFHEHYSYLLLGTLAYFHVYLAVLHCTHSILIICTVWGLIHF